VKSKISVLEHREISRKEIEERITHLEEKALFSSMQHSIENGVITDNLIVSKITFYSLNDVLGAFIDVETQPRMNQKYLGQGSFDMSDRELRAMVVEVLDRVKDRYQIATTFKDSFPKWGSWDINVTIKNYEIGTYSNGVFKLKGEID
jgi:hypothetical protein